MSAPVDVLAPFTCHDGESSVTDLARLESAVAELVEADREYDAAKVAWDNAPGAAQGIGECDARDGSGPEFVRFMSATRRRAAALAKFGGAA